MYNAVHYRVEWAPGADDEWTNFMSASFTLDDIPGAGSGPITASVPMLYRVVAIVTSPPPPPGMVLIPAGSFVMGNATNVFPASEGDSDELPQHTVYVSGFYMDIYEAAKSRWDEVYSWATSNNYSFYNDGFGKAPNHPVVWVNWYDVMKWCNARSQRDGLTPVYYTDAGLTTIYKIGTTNLPFANWSANGYRLPTEAEWEKAARGGAANTRFPRADHSNFITWVIANYFGDSLAYSYDLCGGTGAYHPNFDTDGYPYTSPVDYFAPKGYGLHDMAGNVREWCWDWYEPGYYASSPMTDPRGPADPLLYRVLRGGSWGSLAEYLRVAERFEAQPDAQSNDAGFRCARGL